MSPYCVGGDSLNILYSGTASHLSLASETELSEVINFLSGRPRGSPDEADTESMCSTRALSDSGIESVNNAKVGVAAGKVGGAEMEDQPKGKKGKKKDKKAAAKSESFKKKKKKRSDRKKEKKKAAAEEQENTGKEEDMKTITEGGYLDVLFSQIKVWFHGIYFLLWNKLNVR
jgi:hypothetical protein